MAPRPSPPAKMSKMLIRVNPLVYSLCGEYSISVADENDSELIKEWVTHLAKTTFLVCYYNMVKLSGVSFMFNIS
jgi:hypothetical protein